MKARRYSISFSGPQFQAIKVEAERRGLSPAALIMGALNLDAPGLGPVPVVTRDTAPPMVARLMEAIVEPRRNVRGKSPDGRTMRDVHNDYARLAVARSQARTSTDPTKHAPRPGRDEPQSQPVRTRVPVAKAEAKW